MGKRDAARGRYDGLDESRLNCYGCAHSSLEHPWPGEPSYEQVCSFCIRNSMQHLSDESCHVWPDGSEPVSVPMDAYITVDMKIQMETWVEVAKTQDSETLQRALETARKLQELKR